jgi:transketolase
MMKEKNHTESPFIGQSSRDAFGKVIVELGAENEAIVALTADLTDSVKLNEFKEKFPNRFFNLGVAEQNMMGVAAGLTLAGKIPYACTYAVFSSMRALEQVRTDIAYNDLPVRIVSSHGGISFGIAGATHQAIEDIGIYRGIAGMTVLVPADAVETAAILRASVGLPGPVYVRLNRIKEKPVYTHEVAYQIGTPDLVESGEDVLLVATGAQVGESIEAAKLLHEHGVDVGVLNVSSIKPIDQTIMVDILNNYPIVITVEQHNINNGLGSAIAEIIAENRLNIRFRRHGLMDIFPTSGPYEELLAFYHLDPQGIHDTVIRFLDGVE